MPRVLIMWFGAVLAFLGPDSKTELIPAGPPPGPGSYFRHVEVLFETGTMPLVGDLQNGMAGKWFQYVNGHQPLDAELFIKSEDNKPYIHFKGQWCPLLPAKGCWSCYPKAGAQFQAELQLRKIVRPNKQYAIVGKYLTQYSGSKQICEAVYYFVQNKTVLPNVAKKED